MTGCKCAVELMTGCKCAVELMTGCKCAVELIKSGLYSFYKPLFILEHMYIRTCMYIHICSVSPRQKLRGVGAAGCLAF